MDQSPSITFFPGKGIYYLPSGEEIVSVYKTDDARQVFSAASSLMAGDLPGTDSVTIEMAQQLLQFYAREGISFKSAPLPLPAIEATPLDFSTVSHTGTRSSTNPQPVEWNVIENDLLEKGYSLKRRPQSSNVFDEVCPVFVVEGPEGVIAEGKGLDAAQAKRSALAEAVERVSGSKPGIEASKNIVISTYQKVYGRDPGVLNTCTGPRDAFAADVLTEWLPAINVSAEKSSFFPVEQAYFEHVPDKPRTRLFSLHHTMGLAAGSSLEDAALSGLFECIERDAYWITMRCRITCPDIPLSDVPGLDARVVTIVEALSKEGLVVSLKDMSLDWGVPIAHAVITDTRGGIPAFAHGTGASFDWPAAIARAVCEAVQMYVGLNVSMNEHFAWEDVVSVKGVLGGPDLAWSDPLFEPHLRHLITPSNKAWNKDVRAWTVADFLEHLRARGHEVIVADLHSDPGLKVVRVFVTNTTQPDPRLERISVRLEAWCKKEGLTHGFYTDPILT